MTDEEIKNEKVEERMLDMKQVVTKTQKTAKVQKTFERGDFI